MSDSIESPIREDKIFSPMAPIPDQERIVRVENCHRSHARAGECESEPTKEVPTESAVGERNQCCP